MLPSGLDAQFGTPYPRSAGFDTDIGAFIESSTASSKTGLMGRLVIKDNTTSGGALASGQGSSGGDVVLDNKVSHLSYLRRHNGTLNESTNVGVKTGRSRVGGPSCMSEDRW